MRSTVWGNSAAATAVMDITTEGNGHQVKGPDCLYWSGQCGWYLQDVTEARQMRGNRRRALFIICFTNLGTIRKQTGMRSLRRCLAGRRVLYLCSIYFKYGVLASRVWDPALTHHGVSYARHQGRAPRQPCSSRYKTLNGSLKSPFSLERALFDTSLWFLSDKAIHLRRERLSTTCLRIYRAKCIQQYCYCQRCRLP